MKYLLLSVFAFIIFSSTIKKQPKNTDTTNMVMVKRDTFMMGLDSIQLKNAMQKYNAPFDTFSQEYPAFKVLVVAFYLDKCEVTNADFKKFIDANPRWSKANIPDSLQDGNYLKDWNGTKYPKAKANYPVTYVCWYAANAYARWKGKRLPMEVEFELAAKSGSKVISEFPWGNDEPDTSKANFQQSPTGHPVQVGHYPPNSLGLYDMAGNVFEFCQDWWHTNAYLKRAQFKKDRLTGSFRQPDNENAVIKHVVVRGGGWNSPAIDLRVTHHESRLITSCNADVGFRCAASVQTN